MKKNQKMIVLISLAFCFVVGITAFATGTGLINIDFVDYKIRFNGREMNDFFQNPLISYNDRTYVSIRDVAMMISRDVNWNELYEEIEFVRMDPAEHLIKSEDTALAIGKAIALEHYPDRINENTKYLTVFLEAGPTGIDYYEVNIMFDPPMDKEIEFLEMINESDVKIGIGAAIGGTSISENIGGSWKWVLGRTGRLEID